MDHLPLPVAVLRRRSHNAKSAKDRHDAAYFAWEVSVRLAVAAQPPSDRTPLAARSLGAWVRALPAAEERIEDASLRDAASLLSRVGTGEALPARRMSARSLLDALPAYRNRVIGHGSIRSAEFYEDAGRTLLSALSRAWASGLFLPPESRLVYVDAVEVTAERTHRARVLDLAGEAPLVLHPAGTAVPDDVRPATLYLMQGARWQRLAPWLLYLDADARERVLVFDSLVGKGARYLDYASGDTISGRFLEKLFPGVTEELQDALQGAMTSSEAEAPTDDGAPDRFGEFQIVGKLGQGGMGIVYLARQESLGRLTALKMLPPGAAENEVAVLRFQREVQALSRCEHPNVVKILSYGQVDETHYYAMEYVEGAPLGAVARALTTNEDLTSAISQAASAVKSQHSELFADVPDIQAPLPASLPRRDRWRHLAELFAGAARGLHHMHERGILHRDIKPDNLIVTARDHRAVVMDLGLAQLADVSESITRADTGILGTLRYMPPEQLQMDLLDLDARTDVYALGATLYELATERPLHDGESVPRLVEQVLRETPTAPETAQPAMPPDLALIISKAIEKDPKRRYASAAACAADLEAFVQGRPISARPPTFRYLLGLALKKHKLAAGAVLLGLLLAIGGTVWFIQHLRGVNTKEAQLRKAAELGRTEAREQLERAEDLAEFMLLSLKDDLKRLGRLPLLAKVAHKADEYYANLPDTGVPWISLRGRALAHDALGTVFRSKGELELASARFANAERIFLERFQEDPSDIEAGLRSLTSGRHGTWVLRMQGKIEKARAKLNELRARGPELRAAGATEDQVAAFLSGIVLDLAEIARGQGDGTAAKALNAEVEQLIQVQQDAGRMQRDWRDELITVLRNSAEIELEEGLFDAAEARYRRLLEIVDAQLAEDPDNAIAIDMQVFVLQDLGLVLTRKKMTKEAFPYFEKALGIARQIAARDATNWDRLRELATAITRVGDARLAAGDPPGAETCYAEAVGILEQAIAKESSNALAVRTLSVVHYKRSDLYISTKQWKHAHEAVDTARTEIERLIAMSEGDLDPRWGRFHIVQQKRRVYQAQGDLPNALRTAREQLVLITKLVEGLPADHDWRWNLAASHNALGDQLKYAGTLDEALAAYQDALKVYDALAALDAEDRYTQREISESCDRIARLLFSLQRYQLAMPYHARAVKIAESLVGSRVQGADRLEQFLWTQKRSRLVLAATPFLSGKQKAQTAAEHVTQAMGHYWLDEHVKAATHFAAVLPPTTSGVPTGLADPFHAVRSAGYASQSRAKDSAVWLERTFDWLALDCERRLALLREAKQGPDFDAQRGELLKHLTFIESEEEDAFTRAREDPRFAAQLKKVRAAIPGS